MSESYIITKENIADQITPIGVARLKRELELMMETGWTYKKFEGIFTPEAYRQVKSEYPQFRFLTWVDLNEVGFTVIEYRPEHIEEKSSPCGRMSEINKLKLVAAIAAGLSFLCGGFLGALIC